MRKLNNIYLFKKPQHNVHLTFYEYTNFWFIFFQYLKIKTKFLVIISTLIHKFLFWVAPETFKHNFFYYLFNNKLFIYKRLKTKFLYKWQIFLIPNLEIIAYLSLFLNKILFFFNQIYILGLVKIILVLYLFPNLLVICSLSESSVPL